MGLCLGLCVGVGVGVGLGLGFGRGLGCDLGLGRCCLVILVYVVVVLVLILVLVLVSVSMESPGNEGTPRVTRRRTAHGEKAPPLEFDKGWSCLRARKTVAGLCVIPSPRPPPPLHIRSLPLYLSAGLGAKRATLHATSAQKSRQGLSVTQPPTRPSRTALLHAIRLLHPWLAPPDSQHYALLVFFMLGLPDISGACKTNLIDGRICQKVNRRCVSVPYILSSTRVPFAYCRDLPDLLPWLPLPLCFPERSELRRISLQVRGTNVLRNAPLLTPAFPKNVVRSPNTTKGIGLY